MLRGYDLPIKRNYLNAALLGYGKHQKTDEDKEEIYKNFRLKVIKALNECYKAFSDKLRDGDVEFWHSRRFYDALCAFTRFAVAGWSESSSDFFNNLEDFLREIAASRQYIYLVENMDALMDEQKARKKIPAGYKKLKEESKNDIRSLVEYRLPFQEPPPFDKQGFIDLILACIVYSTKTPEEFEKHWVKFKDKITMTSDADVMKIFSEDLQDTAADDYDDESEGEYDPEDLDFVVSDDFIEYEPGAKKRRLTKPEGSDDEDSDDEGEVNGSGFYDWWW